MRVLEKSLKLYSLGVRSELRKVHLRYQIPPPDPYNVLGVMRGFGRDSSRAEMKATELSCQNEILLCRLSLGSPNVSQLSPPPPPCCPQFVAATAPCLCRRSRAHFPLPCSSTSRHCARHRRSIYCLRSVPLATVPHVDGALTVPHPHILCITNSCTHPITFWHNRPLPPPLGYVTRVARVYGAGVFR